MIKRLTSDFKLEYGVSSLDFGMVRKSDDDEEAVALVIGFKPCRDYLHDVIRCQLHGGSDWYSKYNSEKHKPVDMDVFRLVLRIKDENADRIPILQHSINTMEDVAGIENKLTIHKIEADLKPKESAYLMEGDKFWISTPYAMSIVSLVARWTISRLVKVPKKFESYDYEELLKHFKKAKVETSSDTSYMTSMLKGLTAILKYREEIFCLPPERAYPDFDEYTRDEFHSKGGIHELCNFRTGMKSIQDPLKKRMKETK